MHEPRPADWRRIPVLARGGPVTLVRLRHAPRGGLTSVTGTSASAALVAGGAALLLGNDRTASNAAVLGRLATSAARAGTITETGNGRLDLVRALKLSRFKTVAPTGVAGRQVGGPFVGPYLIESALTGPTVAGAGICANTLATGQ